MQRARSRHPTACRRTQQRREPPNRHPTRGRACTARPPNSAGHTRDRVGRRPGRGVGWPGYGEGSLFEPPHAPPTRAPSPTTAVATAHPPVRPVGLPRPSAPRPPAPRTTLTGPARRLGARGTPHPLFLGYICLPPRLPVAGPPP